MCAFVHAPTEAFSDQFPSTSVVVFIVVAE